MEGRGLGNVIRSVSPILSLEQNITQSEHFYVAMFDRSSDEVRNLRETNYDFSIRISGIEGSVGSIITEMIDLDRKFGWLGTSISEPVQPKTIPAPGAPIHGTLNNIPDDEENREVDAAVQGVSASSCIKYPDPQALLDAEKAPPKQKHPCGPSCFSEDHPQPRSRISGSGRWWDDTVYGYIFAWVATCAKDSFLFRDGGGLSVLPPLLKGRPFPNRTT